MSPEEYFLSLGLSKELVVIIIAALPIVELRGAIPVGIEVFNMPWYTAFGLAFVGNLLPVPFILLFFEAVAKWLSRVPVFKRLLDWLLERTSRRGSVLDRYKRAGLALFVAVPLPVTGAWTGALMGVIFGLGFRYSIISIVSGVIIAGVIVTTLTLMGWVGAIIAGVALCSLAVFSLLNRGGGSGGNA